MSDHAKVDVEPTHAFGRKTGKESLSAKKMVRPPSYFVDSGYLEGMKDSMTDLLVRDIIKCKKTSDLPSIIGDSTIEQIEQMEDRIKIKKERYEQAVERLRGYRDTLKEQEGTKDKIITPHEVESSSKHTSVKKRKLEADAQPTLVTSAHTLELVEQQPDQQEPTSSKIDIARPSHQGVTPVKKRRVPTEKTMDWPHTIDVLVGDIQEKMNELKDDKGGCSKDLEPCWYDLISGRYGDAIKELLMIVVDSETPSLQLSEMQKRMVDSGIIELPEGEKEETINDVQSKELKQYLERRIFNGKLVLFTFYDLCKFIRKMNGYKKVYNVPDRLFWLGDEIRRVLYCTHFEKGLTLEWNEGWDQLCKSRLKKQIIDLMSVISLAGSDRVDELRKLQEKLHCVIKKNLPFVASNFDGKDKKITSRQAEDFYEYIKKICCRPDLIRIDLDKLRIHLTTIDDNSGIDNEEEMIFQY